MSATPQERPSTPIPTGTVTFVFTDIEGSTERWDRDRSAMQAAVRRHDELMRAAIAAHSGYVFKTIGDAFCAAFERPEDAVAAMLDVQRSLSAEDFTAVGGMPVRMALHTGTADERDADYFGPAVNRVARLLALAHGGQILLSSATADLVAGTLPAEATLRDLGEHRLRDLARPERVHQVLAPHLRADFPPLRSLDHHPNNLPRLVTSFVGRETEIAEIADLLSKHALVTVTGSGGVGKTRTLLEVAATLLDGWRDGVWFIELAPLTSGKYIPRTVAHALGLSFATRGNALDHLARALQPKQALLVIDNCEHLLEAAAHVASTLLRHCPQVKLLASSRQRLGIAGEETYPLPSLDTTTNDAAAITLFAERARAANKRFALTEDNAPSVTEICRRLDGIPLAIELAASRVNVLAPRQLLERLDARFALLTGGSRDALPRQQTLQATIDWSHDLLDAPRRALFRRLGIFVNGFTLEGAAAVGGSGLEGSDVFEVLASLLDRSLVHAVPDGERLRYRLLESTRVYASERLAEAGERAAVAACHLRYLRDRFAQVMAEVHQSARVSDLTETLATELEDVRAALAGALDRSDVIAGGELNVHLGRGMSFIGLAGEERTWCEKFIPAIPGDRPDIAARLRLKLSSNLLENGQSARAMELAEQAVAFARESGDPETLGWALKEYSGAAIELGRLDDAETALAEAERIPRISTFLRLRLLRLRALLTEARGEHEAALRMFGDVVNEARLRGDSVVEQRTLRHVVLGEHQRGRTHEAIAIARDVLATHGSGLDTEERARWLRYLAMFLAAAGDHLPEAAAAAREATVVFAMQGPEGPAVTAAIEVQALIYALLGDVDRAATLAGYAEAAYRREPFQRESAGAGAHERLVALLRERLAPAGLERLSAHGARLTPEAAVAVALEEPARHAGG